MDQIEKIKTADLVLFDGVCNLCNASIKFIIRQDRKHKFVFASLQSAQAQHILRELAPGHNDLSSIVYIRKGEVLIKSTAVLNIFRYLQFPLSISAIFLLVPKFFRDFVYDLIAKSRYSVFGKSDACMVPTEELKRKFPYD